MADPDVVNQAYLAAIRITDNRTVLNALFQAGIVESNFRNLSGGDRDSQGFLQQRPSQGWTNPTDVAHATQAFVTKALAKLKANPNLSASQLAQAVQVSAYPSRYAAASQQATNLLADVQDRLANDLRSGLAGALGGIGTAGGAVGTGTAAGATGTAQGLADAAQGPLGAVVQAIKDAFAPLMSVQKFLDKLFEFFLPTNLVRICAGIAGGFFVIFGVVLLAREVKSGA